MLAQGTTVLPEALKLSLGHQARGEALRSVLKLLESWTVVDSRGLHRPGFQRFKPPAVLLPGLFTLP